MGEAWQLFKFGPVSFYSWLIKFKDWFETLYVNFKKTANTEKCVEDTPEVKLFRVQI